MSAEVAGNTAMSGFGDIIHDWLRAIVQSCAR